MRKYLQIKKERNRKDSKRNNGKGDKLKIKKTENIKKGRKFKDL